MTRTTDSLKHPYLTGNFAPEKKQLSLQPCRVHGTIPNELVGGQYVHNGGNQLTHSGSERANYHFFDGHGMLRAVYFPFPKNEKSDVQPLYSNHYVLTDLFQVERKLGRLGAPILPSISTLIDPKISMFIITRDILRTVLLVIFSWLNPSIPSIKRISVANTSVVAHDGRILAMCESGPPMQILLPELSTVGWFDCRQYEVGLGSHGRLARSVAFIRRSLLDFFQEWTTAHPHVDPVSGEMMLFHSTFVRPFVYYSVVPCGGQRPSDKNAILTLPVPGLSSPKMMHDFGVSRHHTIIIDMPLSLDPFNITRGKPVIGFDEAKKTRFGILPRHHPEKVQWLSTEACCIFHTVNTWDEIDNAREGREIVNMLVCRLTSPSIVFASGNLPKPSSQMISDEECRLYYYQFSMGEGGAAIAQQWALTAIPFELPHVPGHVEMSAAQFVYGCSILRGTYAQQLESAMKVSSLVKVNVRELIARGLENPPNPVVGCVDKRPIEDIIAAASADDAIKVFPMPEGHYAQECSFVPRQGGVSEDDGWILTFVFDESQLNNDGVSPEDANSELWVIDARNMKDVVARIELPGRAPYGFHGNWFNKEQLERQRPPKKPRGL